MPNITYNGQSFAIDGRRIWLLGASIQYARVPAELWAARIAAARQAGFNTIETACPWMVHEPRRGRFVFDGEADVRKFVHLCGAAGMRVVLRVGPFVGDRFDGGGLPGWLIEMPDIRLRESDSIFLEHASRFLGRLLSEVADLQVTNGGPIVLVQAEHAWKCSNERQADHYLNEITRFIRENGISVPIINANDLWQDVPGTIDTWRGYDDLLVHLRQLRTVQNNAPRLVSAFEAADYEIWGEHDAASARRGSASRRTPRSMEHISSKSPPMVLRRLAEILASGAQPIVNPFHGGTNFEFLGGRVAGRPDGFVATCAASDAPLGEAGTRGSKYHVVRRLITFANHFSQVFAELDPEYQPIVLDPEVLGARQPGTGAAASVVPLRGPAGRIVFVFAEHAQDSDGAATLVLDDGIRLPVYLGDQPVGWFALDVDLHGIGRLDFSNICPWGLIDRSILVFHGPARAPVYISIAGTPLEVTIPAGDAKPLVLLHKGLTVLICNQQQIDSTYHDDAAVYVGVAGLDENGRPLRDARFDKAYVIRRDARLDPITFDESPGAGKSGRRQTSRARGEQVVAPAAWEAASAMAHVSGQSPRFASLEGPEPLSECGAPNGYGWYRVTVNATGRKLCHLPFAADRAHLFLDGKPQHLFGVGPAAEAGPFELRFGKGAQTLVALLDNLGRFAEGNDLGERKGLWGHLYEVKNLRVPKPKLQAAQPVNPFKLRGYIEGRDATHMSDTWQAVWTFAHTRKTPLLIDIAGAACSGTLVLNDELIAYYAGATGGCQARIMIDPAVHKAFKRGKNLLRFAPDLRQENAVDQITDAVTIYECLETITDADSWAFAKWEPPSTASYSAVEKSQMRSLRNFPCWWRSTFQLADFDPSPWSPSAWWLETAGMSKGQAYINGRNIGRYFTATGSGKAVGPQTRLYVPTPWLKAEHNELVMFDEHGCDPTKVRLIRTWPDQG